jgi:hypothetical protein
MGVGEEVRVGAGVYVGICDDVAVVVGICVGVPVSVNSGFKNGVSFEPDRQPDPRIKILDNNTAKMVRNIYIITLLSKIIG